MTWLKLLSFWREITIGILLVVAFFGVKAFRAQIESLNASIATANQNAGAMNQKIDGLREDNKVYRETLKSVQIATEELRKSVTTSQTNVNRIAIQQQQVLDRINKVDLSNTTAEEKFDWMIEEAIRDNQTGAKK